MGLLGPMPILGDPCHSHAYRRCPNIHRGYSSVEVCQCRHVMEPDPWGQDLGGGALVARPCGARWARSPGARGGGSSGPGGAASTPPLAARKARQSWAPVPPCPGDG